MLLQNPIVVEVTRQPPITPEISYGSILASAALMAVAILVAAALVGGVVGAIIIAGEAHDTLSAWLGAAAVFASTTNLVSGYLITDRMLRMFKRKEAAK